TCCPLPAVGGKFKLVILRAVAYALASWGGNFSPMIRDCRAAEEGKDLTRLRLRPTSFISAGSERQA
ncbi:MAG TPA: hypothetical protein VK626_00245, partial [Nitrospiraceae bacterium]|nr:hypothetical protein [Nitrospiraceae bacterium]